MTTKIVLNPLSVAWLSSAACWKKPKNLHLLRASLVLFLIALLPVVVYFVIGR